MKRLAIIADDLTGASDSGVQLAAKGLHTQVIFDWNGLRNDSAAFDAIVLDTDSRSVPEQEAYLRVRNAAEALKAKGYTFIYKKLDSTLRGNLGQEMDAVMDVFGFEAAIVVPAFPRIGRTTVDGIHYLNGVPINETEIARDPKTPVPEAEIRKLLASQSRRTCVHIRLSEVRSGSEPLVQRIRQVLEQHAELIVIDAETDEDMKLISALVSVYENRFLWAGSAGLAEYLPVTAGAVAYRTELDIPEPEPVMLVAGSISKVTREQVRAVNGQQGVTSVELDPNELLTSPEQRKLEVERCFNIISGALVKGLDVSFYAGSSPGQVASAKELGARIGLDSSSVSNRIADALGEVASRVVSEHKLQGLVLTGGDTAKAVCRHLGVHGIELVAELEPGIPLGRLLGAGDLMAVTKAGAFGNEQSLWHAMQLLKGEHVHD